MHQYFNNIKSIIFAAHETKAGNYFTASVKIEHQKGTTLILLPLTYGVNDHYRTECIRALRSIGLVNDKVSNIRDLKAALPEAVIEAYICEGITERRAFAMGSKTNGVTVYMVDNEKTVSLLEFQTIINTETPKTFAPPCGLKTGKMNHLPKTSNNLHTILEVVGVRNGKLNTYARFKYFAGTGTTDRAALWIYAPNSFGCTSVRYTGGGSDMMEDCLSTCLNNVGLQNIPSYVDNDTFLTMIKELCPNVGELYLHETKI